MQGCRACAGGLGGQGCACGCKGRGERRAGNIGRLPGRGVLQAAGQGTRGGGGEAGGQAHKEACVGSTARLAPAHQRVWQGSPTPLPSLPPSFLFPSSLSPSPPHLRRQLLGWLNGGGGLAGPVTCSRTRSSTGSCNLAAATWRHATEKCTSSSRSRCMGLGTVCRAVTCDVRPNPLWHPYHLQQPKFRACLGCKNWQQASCS